MSSIRNRTGVLLKNTFVAALGVFVAFLLGEGLIRLMSPSAYVADSRLGVIGSSGEHDTRGFRNTASVEQAQIVVLGDSQTYGNNAEREEAWPQQLGQIASTTVYQMAFGGYSALQYKDLVSDALALHPKILVLAFYAGNDLLETYTGVYDSTSTKWNIFRNPEFIPPATTSDPLTYRQELQTGLSRNTLEFQIWRIRYWIRLHSRLYAFLGDATREFRERLGVAKTMEEKHQQFSEFARAHPDVAYVFEADRKLKTILSPAYRLEGVNLDEPRTQEGWRITEEILHQISEQAGDARVPLVLLYIPTKELAYLEYMRQNSLEIPPAFRNIHEAELRLQETFLNYCRAIGAYCHSVAPALAAALASGEKVYGETMDGHPLAKGYEVIAKSLWEYLINQSYAPGSLAE